MDASARQNLATAVKTCLLEIKESSGYSYTIRQAFDPPINIEQMKQYPTINILWGDERRIGEVKTGGGQLYDVRLPVQFDCFLNVSENQTIAQNKMLSDLQRYFGINYYIQPAGETRTAFEIIYGGAMPFGTERTAPNCGISVDFDIYYSFRQNDPRVMV